MKLKKLTTDPITLETVQIVDNSYILLGTEEWVYDAVLAEQFYNYARIDYIRFRKYCKILAETVWETLDADSRHVCIDNYVKPTTLTWEATGYTDEQLHEYWINMVKLEKECRSNRMDDCIYRITWEFTGEESMKCLDDIFIMMNKWIFGEYPELYFFTNSLAGTILDLTFDYTTNGFASKSYYTLYRLNLVNEILFND